MAKILLVEDDNNLREIFEARLQAEGYQTVTAGNGEEGLTVAMREKPDLIIADIMMPKLSGFEMLETLRAAPEMKDVKVIMMTALGQAEDQSRGEGLGVVKYLVKSQATLEDFTRAVKEVLPAGGSSDKDQAENSTRDTSQDNNQQESENSMQEDTTPTNQGAAGDSTPADSPTNPVTGPSNDGQLSTAQEQSNVQGQIDSFVDNSSPSAPAAPAAPTADSTPADSSASFAPSTPPAGDSAGGLSDTSTDAPDVPAATPPADTPPAVPPQSDQPEQEADKSGDASTSGSL